MHPMIGMYVHMHWGYGHPYCARTWTVEDWRAYASGLAAMGYNAIMIWPMLEIIPDPPTPSDAAHLRKMETVIAMLRGELGFRVWITMAPNTAARPDAARYAFENRPFFRCDRRLDPADPAQMDALFASRRAHMAHLAHADGFVVIDSDPGGYIGSTAGQFTDVLVRYGRLIQDVRAGAELVYWMWMGWEPYNSFWAAASRGDERTWTHEYSDADWEPVLDGLRDRCPEPWSLLSCWPQHRALLERKGLLGRAAFLPYGLVEGEPEFPLTALRATAISSAFARPVAEGRGAFANAQSHVAQIPNTYLFARAAAGKPAELGAFAESLVAGCGTELLEGWTAAESGAPDRMRRVADTLAARAQSGVHPGPSAGILLMPPNKFLEHLALQLRFRADMEDAAAAVTMADRLAALAKVGGSLRRWWEVHRFSDACCGPVRDRLLPALRALADPGLNAALDDFDNWRAPERRHDLIPRLLRALERRLAVSP